MYALNIIILCPIHVLIFKFLIVCFFENPPQKTGRNFNLPFCWYWYTM